MAVADKLLSTQEVADMIGIKRVTVNLWVRQGKLAHYRIGNKKTFIPLREAQRVLLEGYRPARGVGHDGKS